MGRTVKVHCIFTHIINIELHSCVQGSLEISGVTLNLQLGVFPSFECCMSRFLFVNVRDHLRPSLSEVEALLGDDWR